ncbi:DUF3307 domain-containing protein [Burkholderia sp. BCC1988]|uniref:DUF3307 domain-containing protein n=1 Tax=Burkholderia sp. BCC1988 TaxID=2817443 RepID=UPI002AAFE3F3|nr:DUF3307 domain-containing protein [Burkholderia sp. BCC1988]
MGGAHAIAIFFALLVGHALADYPLQGDFLARAKNRFAPVTSVPWYQALAAHALIHMGIVWLMTGIWRLGAPEFIAHAVIDSRSAAASSDSTLTS